MNYNHLFIIVVASVTIISILSFGGFSYAQSSILKSQSLSEYGMFIYVQTMIRNSEGQLVTTLGSSSFTNLNLQALQTLLKVEANENDPIVTIKDQKFQIIKRKMTIPQQKENGIASTLLFHTLGGKTDLVARFAHDGYRVVEGDTVLSVWTFIVKVN